MIRKYFAENKFGFQPVMGGTGDQYTVGKAYGVRAYPTNFLVDSDGKVLWNGVGFDEKAMREALNKALAR